MATLVYGHLLIGLQNAKKCKPRGQIAERGKVSFIRRVIGRRPTKSGRVLHQHADIAGLGMCRCGTARVRSAHSVENLVPSCNPRRGGIQDSFNAKFYIVLRLCLLLLVAGLHCNGSCLTMKIDAARCWRCPQGVLENDAGHLSIEDLAPWPRSIWSAQHCEQHAQAAKQQH